MRCLSVQQPWAWAIIHGPKRIENRRWSTSYRGELLIHAGKSLERIGDYGPGEPRPEAMDFGAIIGVVDLVDCLPLHKAPPGRFAEGPWCWMLDNVRSFATPIPCRGMQGLFEVPDSMVDDARCCDMPNPG